MKQIKLTRNKKLQVLKQVKIKDNCWDRPGGGYLNPGSIIEVTNGPTRISDVPFKVIEGTGEITHRNPDGDLTRKIKAGSFGFFFSQGHETQSPYDFGTLSTSYFKEIN